MYRLIVLLAGVIAAAPAWAVCPTTPGDCPPMTTNNPTIVGVVGGGATYTAPTISGGTLGGSITGTGATITGGTFSGITLSGTIAGTPTFSGAVTNSGSLSLTGAGTALSVTNNATVGGTLTISGAGTSLVAQHAMSVAGLSTLTGGFTSNGTSQILGASSKLVYGNGNNFSFGTAVGAHSISPVQYQSLLSGTISSGTAAYLDIWVSSDSVVAPTANGELAAVIITHTTASGAVGNRWAEDVSFHAAAASTNMVGGGLRAQSFAAANLGGTGLTSGTALGGLFGVNFAANCNSGATNLVGCVGQEQDIAIASGASALDKIGIQVVQVSTDAVQGVRDDVAVSVNNQSGAPGWNVVFGVGRSIGPKPYPDTGTFLATVPNTTTGQAPEYKAAYGVDFRVNDFSGCAFASPGYCVAGSGSVQIGPGALSPSTSGMKLDAPGQQTTAIAVNVGSGGPYAVNDEFLVPSAGVIGKVTSVDVSNHPTGVSIVVPGYTQTTPGCTTNCATVGGGGNGAVNALTVDLTWSATSTVQIGSSGNTVIGTGSALATNATAGFVQLATMAGSPSGTVGAAGKAAVIIDTTNKKICYSTGGGTWECSGAFTP